MTINRTVNVTELVDRSPLTQWQVVTFILCGLVALLDGVDTQSIGVAAPMIAGSLHMKMSSFGPVFSAAQFGATLGALSFGPLADRFGRKPMLVVAILCFAIFTLLTPLTHTLPSLVAIRFLSGIGLGGATPCFITMTSEYAPERIRGTLVSVLWAAYPLGAALGGFFNSYIVSHFTWQVMFLIGGVLPLAVTILLMALLPESMQYLAARGQAGERIARLARRFEAGIDAATTTFVATDQKKTAGVPIRLLFTDGRAVGTLLLWLTFFMAFATTNIMVMWTPTLLRAHAIPVSAGAIVLGFFNLGAFFGMAMAGRLVDRFGPARALIPAFVAACVFIVLESFGATSVASASALVFGAGFTVGIGGAGAIAIAALVYPVEVRSTGVGWGMGSARFGQVVAPLVIGMLLGMNLGTERILQCASLAPLIAGAGIVLISLFGRRLIGNRNGKA